MRNRRLRPSRSPARVQLEALETRQLLATFTVTNVADTGTGSLRQAILSSNLATSGTNTIDFAIPGTGVQTIVPASPLPTISNPTVVDGTSQPGYAGTPLIELDGAGIFQMGVTPPTPVENVAGLSLDGGASTVEGLTINRFTGPGIEVGSTGNAIVSDFIGTDQTGTRALGNGTAGIFVNSRNNTIGGGLAPSRNVISGNDGIGIYFGSLNQPANNLVEGNLIGTDVTGQADLGNGLAGVFIQSSNNTIGGTTASQGNVIAYNGGAGVAIGSYYYQGGVTQDRITGNSIFGNVGLGIDLGDDGVSSNRSGASTFGPNLQQNYPVLTSAYATGTGTTVEGTLNSAANSAYTIAFYSDPVGDPSGFGQGRTFLGSTVVTTDASGIADVTTALTVAVPVNQVVTATATDGSGNTSEFARTVLVLPHAEADVLVMASNQSPSPQAGVPYTYTFNVLSNGPSVATGAVLTDTLPLGAVFDTGTTSQGTIVSTSNGVVSVALGKLLQNGTATVSLTYTLPAAGPASNQVRVSADQADPTTQNNTISQSYTVLPAPTTDLAVTGTTFPSPIQVGANLYFTFVVSNLTQTNAATGATFSDTLPTGLTYVTATSSQGTISQSGGLISASLGTIAGGASATVTIEVTPTVSGQVFDIANVGLSQVDPDPTNNSTTVFVQVSPASPVNLSLFGSASPSSAEVQTNLTYTFVVTNPEYQTESTGATFRDQLPSSVTFVSATASQGTTSETNGLVIANLGNIPAGALATVTIVVKPTDTSTLTNTASVTGNEPDPNPLDNSTTVITTVAPAPTIDLGVEILSGPQPAEVGGAVTYTVLFANGGATSATDVILTDQLPDNAAVASIRPSQGTYTLSGETLTVNLGTVAPGTLGVVTITLMPGAPGTLLDRASIIGDQPDLNIANNSASQAIAVIADTTAPTILNQKLTVASNAITAVVLTFDKALDATLAGNPLNYQILDLGTHGSLASSGKSVGILSATYSSSTRSVTLTPRSHLLLGHFYKLVVNGPGAPGLVDRSGNVLDGVGNGLQNSIFESLIGRGTITRPTQLQLGAATPKPSKITVAKTTSTKSHTATASASVKVTTASVKPVGHVAKGSTKK